MTDSEGNEIGKLFVGGLSQATNNASLRIYFSRFGEVDDAVVMMDNKTGRSRGFGYVKYKEAESVNSALEAKPHILDGKEVDAKQCNINMKGRNRRSLKIFVGGIGLDQDAESIKNFFRQFGRVTDVNLMMDSNKQRHRGFAFVGFEDESVVKRLINLHYVMMNTKQVEIKAMEPPNFGRKISQNLSLTTATLMAGTMPADGPNFETGVPESSGLLTAGAQFVNPIPYIPTQPTGISCLSSNVLARPPVANLYDQHTSNFNTMMESFYQPSPFLQPTPHTNKGMEQAQTAGSYIGPKPPVPMILTSGQYHNSSSVYTPIPYPLISPAYIPPPPQQTSVSAATRSASSQLALCTSHLQPANNLLPCQPFSSTQPIHNPSQADLTGAIGPVLGPYYTLCPQYTSIPVQPDQPLAASYTTAPLGNNSGSCIIQGAVQTISDNNTAGGSRPESPIKGTEPKVESTQKVAYPTIVMASPGCLSSVGVVASSNLTQTPWNQAQPNMVYSSLPTVGWTLHAGPQTAAAWPAIPQQVPFIAGVESIHNPKSAVLEDKPESSGETAMTAGTSVSQTQASGDGMDGVVPTTRENGSTYAYVKTSHERRPVSETGGSWQSDELGRLTMLRTSWSGRWEDKNEESMQPSNHQTWTSSTTQNNTSKYDSKGSFATAKQMPMNSGSTSSKLTEQSPSSNRADARADETQTNGTRRAAETEYNSWLYPKPTAATEPTGGKKKELPANIGVELECHVPAGAAGDFHRPVHTAQPYSGHRVGR